MLPKSADGGMAAEAAGSTGILGLKEKPFLTMTGLQMEVRFIISSTDEADFIMPSVSRAPRA